MAYAIRRTIPELAVAAVLVLLGAAGAGCERGRAQTVARSETAGDALPRDTSPPVVAPPEPSAPASQVPDGWRDLKLGMSEREVEGIILRYRNKLGNKWEKSTTTSLPTVRLESTAIDEVVADPKRFHQWSIKDLDDGAGRVSAWFEEGKLVAVQVRGKARPEVFLAKATQALGAAPQNRVMRFRDRSGWSEERDVSIWRNAEAAKLIWSSASLPTLLVWSNVAMNRRAAEYQAVLDAPDVAAKSKEQAEENGTKF